MVDTKSMAELETNLAMGTEEAKSPSGRHSDIEETTLTQQEKDLLKLIKSYANKQAVGTNKRSPSKSNASNSDRNLNRWAGVL